MAETKLSTAQYRVLAQKAESNLDWRLAVIYWTHALYEYPNTSGKLAEADKDKIRTAINSDKEMLLSICPVCGNEMHGTLCPDDITRPWCSKCHKAYTPMGYTDSMDYARKWGVWEYGRDKAETHSVIGVLPGCIHDLARCGKPAVMWTPGEYVHGYYCAEHIPVGFNGVIPEENKIENEPEEL